MDQTNKIEVINRDGWRKEYALQKGIVYIGAAPTNDITLDAGQGTGVALLHAQLIASGSNGSSYRLVNLADGDIVFVDPAGEQSLPPRATLNLSNGQEFRLGEYRLVFRGEGHGYGLPEPGRGGPSIGAQLVMPFTRLAPYQTLEGQIVVSNLGQKTGVTFDLDLEGMPQACYDVAPGPLLSSGAEKGVLFRLHHRGHEPLAGDWRILIRVTAAKDYPGEVATVAQIIQVLPHYQHRSRIVAGDGVRSNLSEPAEEKQSPLPIPDPLTKTEKSPLRESDRVEAQSTDEAGWGVEPQIASPAAAAPQAVTRIQATSVEAIPSASELPVTPGEEELWSAPDEVNPPLPTQVQPSEEAEQLWAATPVEEPVLSEGPETPLPEQPAETVGANEPEAEQPVTDPHASSIVEPEIAAAIAVASQIDRDNEGSKPVQEEDEPRLQADAHEEISEPDGPVRMTEGALADRALEEIDSIEPSDQVTAGQISAPGLEVGEPSDQGPAAELVEVEKTWWQRLVARFPFSRSEGLSEAQKTPVADTPSPSLGPTLAPRADAEPSSPITAEAELIQQPISQPAPERDEFVLPQNDPSQPSVASPVVAASSQSSLTVDETIPSLADESNQATGEREAMIEEAVLPVTPQAEAGSMAEQTVTQTDEAPAETLQEEPQAQPIRVTANEVAVPVQAPDADQSGESEPGPIHQPARDQEIAEVGESGQSDLWFTETDPDISEPEEQPKVIKLKSESTPQAAETENDDAQHVENLDEDWWTEPAEEVDK